jgi:hypothetical protein
LAKTEIKQLENEVGRWQVLVEAVTGISPPDFDAQTLAVLRGRLVRYLMRSREVKKKNFCFQLHLLTHLFNRLRLVEQLLVAQLTLICLWKDPPGRSQDARGSLNLEHPVNSLSVTKVADHFLLTVNQSYLEAEVNCPIIVS